jgi:hypothetical protein
MNIKIEALSEPDSSVWDSIVNNSSQGTVFHSSDWLNLTLEAKPTAKRLTLVNTAQKYYLLRESSDYLGVFSGVEYDFLGLKAIVSPATWSWAVYGGLVVRDSEQERKRDLWRLVMSTLLKDYRVVIVADPPTVDTHGWCDSQIARTTLESDLTLPQSILWSRMRTTRRRDIRKAERSGVWMLEATEDDHVKMYYRLLEQTRERKEFKSLPPLRFFLETFSRLRGTRAKLLLAFRADRLLAGVFLTYDNRRLYYWSGALGDDGLKLGASSFLHWKSILWGKEHGLQTYDMVVPLNIPGVAFFKTSFGGESRLYYQSILTRPNWLGYFFCWAIPAMRDVETGELLRRVRGALAVSRQRVITTASHQNSTMTKK